MRVLTISDIHYDLSLEEKRLIESANLTCDLCFCLGDIPLQTLLYIRKAISLPIYGILGNHDTYDLLEKAGIPNLHSQICRIHSTIIAGIGGSPRYKIDSDRPLYTQREIISVERQLERLQAADILIAHSSPYDRKADLPHKGFYGIDLYLLRKRPLCLIHGHNHEDYQTTKRYPVSKRGRKSTQVICTYRVRIHEI